MKKIYVGNLPFSASEEKVHKVFSQFGEVHSVKLLTDPVTGRIRGFGFVEMETTAADQAIQSLDGAPFEYRTLRVHEAFERTRPPEQPAREKPHVRKFRERSRPNDTVLTANSQRGGTNRRYSQPVLRRG